MSELLDKHGGFRRLHSFTLATIVQLETLRFCRRFLTQDPRQANVKFYDPKGRQYDQMTQAARSGRQNIIEGSERSSTSKATEMKLTDVARASLGELRGDYEIFILDQGQLPWSVFSDEARAVSSISLDSLNYDDDMLRRSSIHMRNQRAKYQTWLDSSDAIMVANALIIIISRAMKMLKRQIEHMGRDVVEHGGFSERISAHRKEARDNAPEHGAPQCPMCNAMMRTRTSARGEFWGCTAYPDCRGTRPKGR
jgi:four helix bundle suffix protein